MELGAALGLNRAAGERRELFNPLGEQGELAGTLREHLLQKLGPDRSKAIESAARKWWALRKEVLAEVEASGAFAPRVLEKAKTNPDYVKFYVSLYLKGDRAGRRASGNIHQQFGTLQEIGNPLVETALADLALLRVAHRTGAARSLVDFYRESFPDEIKPARRGRGGVLLPPPQRGQDTLTFLDGGKVHAYYTSERVVSWFEANPHVASVAYRAYNLATRPLKAFAKQVVTVSSPGASKGQRAAGARKPRRRLLRDAPLPAQGSARRHSCHARRRAGGGQDPSPLGASTRPTLGCAPWPGPLRRVRNASSPATKKTTPRCSRRGWFLRRRARSPAPMPAMI